MKRKKDGFVWQSRFDLVGQMGCRRNAWDFILCIYIKGAGSRELEGYGMNLLYVTLEVNRIAALAKERVQQCFMLTQSAFRRKPSRELFSTKVSFFDKPISKTSICIHCCLQTYSGTVFLSQATLRGCEPKTALQLNRTRIESWTIIHTEDQENRAIHSMAARGNISLVLRWCNNSWVNNNKS